MLTIKDLTAEFRLSFDEALSTKAFEKRRELEIEESSKTKKRKNDEFAVENTEKGAKRAEEIDSKSKGEYHAIYTRSFPDPF